MIEQTLFERLFDSGKNETIRSKPVSFQASVADNMTRIFSTRTGHAPAQSSYGMPSVHELVQDFPSCVPQLLNHICINLQLYEKRLGSVRVRYLNRETNHLSFQVNAVHVENNADMYTFIIHLFPDGRVSIT